MKIFCKDLREHATETINFEKKEMLALKKKEKMKYQKQICCHIFNEKFNGMFDEDKKYRRIRDHCHYT